MDFMYKILENLGLTTKVSSLTFLMGAVIFYVLNKMDIVALLKSWRINKQAEDLPDLKDEGDKVLFDAIDRDINKRERFRGQTGINIHPDRIEALKKLRDQSKGMFDWPQIRAACRFVIFTDQGCKIEISKESKVMDFFGKWMFNIAIILFFILLLISAILLVIEETNKLNNFGAMFFSFIGIIGTAFFKASIRRDIKCATLIQSVIK
ncbi:hypothetical protein I6I98_17700 [Sphingobacterium multivorum]|uniref:Uncharacterized protein n=1 Tax=Sphingobacterium multivorum TaxID=28454 RepID=A0ABX7CJ21_SPHMU|nr:hypothetical protein [Sphingobacterium multivorum]QQT52096.1 hypothetical protein I6I98_17700 [Sphingobacterium multivorum]